MACRWWRPRYGGDAFISHYASSSSTMSLVFAEADALLEESVWCARIVTCSLSPRGSPSDRLERSWVRQPSHCRVAFHHCDNEMETRRASPEVTHLALARFAQSRISRGGWCFPPKPAAARSLPLQRETRRPAAQVEGPVLRSSPCRADSSRPSSWRRLSLRRPPPMRAATPVRWSAREPSIRRA